VKVKKSSGVINWDGKRSRRSTRVIQSDHIKQLFVLDDGLEIISIQNFKEPSINDLIGVMNTQRASRKKNNDFGEK